MKIKVIIVSLEYVMHSCNLARCIHYLIGEITSTTL